MMEESNWKEDVLQSLEQRDARELLSSDIYEACILSSMTVLISRFETCDILYHVTCRRCPRLTSPGNGGDTTKVFSAGLERKLTVVMKWDP